MSSIAGRVADLSIRGRTRYSVVLALHSRSSTRSRVFETESPAGAAIKAAPREGAGRCGLGPRFPRGRGRARDGGISSQAAVTPEAALPRCSSDELPVTSTRCRGHPPARRSASDRVQNGRARAAARDPRVGRMDRHGAADGRRDGGRRDGGRPADGGSMAPPGWWRAGWLATGGMVGDRPVVGGRPVGGGRLGGGRQAGCLRSEGGQSGDAGRKGSDLADSHRHATVF